MRNGTGQGENERKKNIIPISSLLIRNIEFQKKIAKKFI